MVAGLSSVGYDEGRKDGGKETLCWMPRSDWRTDLTCMVSPETWTSLPESQGQRSQSMSLWKKWNVPLDPSVENRKQKAHTASASW